MIRDRDSLLRFVIMLVFFNAERIFSERMLSLNKVAPLSFKMESTIVAVLLCSNITLRNKSQVHFITFFFLKILLTALHFLSK